MPASRTITAAIAASLLFGRAVLGQSITCDMAQAPDVSDAVRAEIVKMMQKNGPGLSGDTVAIGAARSQLMQPLKCGAVSLNFRVEYARALLPVIGPLIEDAAAKDQSAANALRLAGELATPGAVPLITRGMADKRASVRYAACFAAGRVFEAVKAPRAAAIGASEMDQLFEALAAFIKTESEPNLLDAAVLALGNGISITSTTIPAFDARSRAVQTLADAMGAKAKSLRTTPGAKTLEVILRAENNIRDVLIGTAAGAKLSRSSLVSAAGFAGDVLALSARTLKAGGGTPAQRDALTSLVSVAEAVVTFSGPFLNTDIRSLNLGNLVRTSKDDQFLKDLQNYTGANGVLTRPPYELPANRFE